MDIFNNCVYNKTTWKNGDVITASKMNKIEEALEIISLDAPYEINLDENIIKDRLLIDVIQEQIDFAYENNYHKVVFPSNKVIELIDSYDGVAPVWNHKPVFLELRSNTEYDLNGCTLKVKTNDYIGYEVVTMTLLKHTVIKNGIIEGDKDEHIYRDDLTHEFGSGIIINACDFCTVQNMEMKNLTGDGVYLGGVLLGKPIDTPQSVMELGKLDINTGETIADDKSYRINKYIKIDDLRGTVDPSELNKLILLPAHPWAYGPLNQFNRKELVVCFYDENYNLVSSVEDFLCSSINIPSNAFYYKYYHPNTDLSKTTDQYMLHRLGDESHETYIEKCHIHDCRRQGVTLGPSKFCGVKECVIERIRGIDPQSCIDIEDGGHRTENVLIENNYFGDSFTGLVCFDGCYHNITGNYFKNCIHGLTMFACVGITFDNNTFVGGTLYIASENSDPGYTPRQVRVTNSRFINVDTLKVLPDVIFDGCIVKNLRTANIIGGSRIYNTKFLTEYEPAPYVYYVFENAYLYNVEFEGLDCNVALRVSDVVFDTVTLERGCVFCFKNVKMRNSKINQISLPINLADPSNFIFEDCVLGVNDNAISILYVHRYPLNLTFRRCEINQPNETMYGIVNAIPSSSIIYEDSIINYNNCDYLHYSTGLSTNCDMVKLTNCVINNADNPHIVSQEDTINNIIFEGNTGVSTLNRPQLAIGKHVGYYYYDKTINKPIWWDGGKWTDYTGVELN